MENNFEDKRRYSLAEATQSQDLDTMYSKEATQVKGYSYALLNSGKTNKKETMKVILPYRRRCKGVTQSPMDTHGLFHSLFYSWMTPLFKKAYKKHPIQEEDLNIFMSGREGADMSSERFSRLWTEELINKGETDASLGKTLYRFVRTRLLVCIVLCILSLGSNFLIGSYVLYSLVNYLGEDEIDIKTGLLMAFFLLLSTSLRALGMSFMWYLSIRTAARMRAAVLMVIYKKLLNMQNLVDTSIGEVVNLFVNDGDRVFEACLMSSILCAVPLFMILLLIATLVLMGVASIVGVVTMLVIFFGQVFMARIIGQLRARCVDVTDKRVRLMGELLTNINLIKKYAWEETLSKTILDVRKEEQSYLQKAGYMQSFTIALATIIAPAASMTTIVTHVLIGGTVTAAEAYTLLSLFYGIALVIFLIPMALKPMAESSIALKRMKVILLMKESVLFQSEKPEDDKHAIELNNGSFSWVSVRPEDNGFTASREELDRSSLDERSEDNELLTMTNGEREQHSMLQNIDLAVPKGHLVGICGEVGSGKSSLLYAILNHMYHVSGTITSNGSMALVSQQAWIQNETVRDNILFSKAYNEKKYKQVVEACCLKHDFDVMANGDSTEIGERGINLSGGQKQRISIARALYADCDIYLLDDPLSAVDTHVGAHIFNKCIKTALRDKTVLFVTHQLQYLEECDSILLMKNGRLLEHGTHQELMEENGEYYNLIHNYLENDDEEEELQDSSDQPDSAKSPVRKNGHFNFDILDEDIDGKLIQEESLGGSVVKAATYKQYVHYIGGYGIAFIGVSLVAITVMTVLATNSCVALWLRLASLKSTNSSMDGSEVESIVGNKLDLQEDLTPFVLLYVSLFAITFILLFIMCYVFVKIVLRGSSSLHKALFQKVIRSPMSFFDTTPLGRILNRFSKDLDDVDTLLPTCLQKFLIFVFVVFFALTVVGFLMPWFFIVLAIVFPLCVLYTIFFRRGFCEFKRLQGTTLSKAVGLLSASMQGLLTIRTFRKTDYFCRRYGRLLDTNTAALELFHTSYRWVNVRMDLLAAFSTGAMALIVVLCHGDIPPVYAGFALFLGISMSSGMLQAMVTHTMETESCFVSVERLMEYLTILKTEAPDIIKENRPPLDWPSEGRLQLDNVQMQYRPNLPMVLKGISMKIKSNERIGIVGRTGSGKSTLGVVLFRMVELFQGKILIDDIDISTIGLKDLRSKLSIIPQDPVLFLGTVRYNLDPLNLYSDDQLWSALEKSNVKDKISQLDSKLMAPVMENGENFSVGERQLICMARAILRQSKILILDEATAAIDTKTDSLIQHTIREAFKDCTMLIIAHRLHTVLDCDRILVMDNGEIGEFDKPDVLLSNHQSLFSKMVAAGK